MELIEGIKRVLDQEGILFWDQAFQQEVKI